MQIWVAVTGSSCWPEAFHRPLLDVGKTLKTHAAPLTKIYHFRQQILKELFVFRKLSTLKPAQFLQCAVQGGHEGRAVAI